jgi:hypothetical protein
MAKDWKKRRNQTIPTVSSLAHGSRPDAEDIIALRTADGEDAESESIQLEKP